MPSPRTRAELYFASRFQSKPAGVAFAPGRLVLLGEHVDHQGGPVLATALPLGVAVAWGPRPDRSVRVVALDEKAGDRFTVGQTVRSGRRWADLLRGAAAVLEKAGLRPPGLDLVVAGDLPSRKGLGSSGAYLVAVLRAFLEASGREASPAELARWTMAVETEWGGVPCGPMDPYVAAVGLVGRPLFVDTKALAHEALPMPEGVVAVPVDTGVERSLPDTPYADRRRALESGLSWWRSSPGDAAARLAALPEAVRGVVRHALTEARRVRDGADALRRGDAAALGRLMDEGHVSLSRDFGASTPEIDALAASVRAREGVLGVRLQGAGWGGCLAVLRKRAAHASGDGATE